LKLRIILMLVLGIALVAGGIAFDVITDFGTCNVLGLCIIIPLLDTPFDLGVVITFLGIYVLVRITLERQAVSASDVPPLNTS
jgi:hypothetical protein